MSNQTNNQNNRIASRATANFSHKSDKYFCSVEELLAAINENDDLVSFEVEEYQVRARQDVPSLNIKQGDWIEKKRINISSFQTKETKQTQNATPQERISSAAENMEHTV